MAHPEISLVLVTAPTRDVASQLADTLIERRLAACVAVLPAVDSVYRWEGKIERSTEFQLLIKTSSARLPELEQCVLELHPYETPELLAIAVDSANARYLQWVLAETAAEPVRAHPR